ncbi:hypothetical protein GCM10025857_02500 [Alicyclobacillus contaminans]|nr:hypothetical protein GCM10025857_02500 [Alicyclobacillus contaminans]
MSVARRRNCLMYVVPTNAVSEDATWTGYVRLGYRRWLALPVPHPEAMYNRIPTRYLERQPATVQAKQILRSLAIPMFNPDYFNKAEVYDVIRAAGLAQYLPETVNQLAATALEQMLVRHRAVYLKPAGGSIGHGMIRIDHAASGFTVSVLKNTSCKTFSAPTFRRLLQMIRQERVPGRYVIQAAVPLLMWKGRPCDFRVLLQKRGDLWSVVGKGVRVAGQHTITTHVPNGGSIADATEVMTKHFGEQSQAVDQRMDDMLIRCAKAIDAHYHYALGEMSMDVGVDDEGHPWFFEANAKPMKFDEADIRSRSLVGVLNHLDHLRQAQAPLTTGANRRG